MSIVEKALITDAANLSVLLLGVGLLAGQLLKRLPSKTLAPLPWQAAISTKKWDVPELILALAVIAMSYVYVVLRVNGDALSPMMQSISNFVSQSHQMLSLIAILLLLVLIRKRDLVEVWGLNKLDPPKVAITAGFLVFATACTLAVYKLFQMLVLEEVVGTPPAQPQIQQLRESPSAAVIISMVIGACVLAPLFEEVIYRGFLYPALKKFVQPVVAAAVVSGIFAAVHLNLGALLPLGVLSLLLILAYEVTGSLLVPIIIHAGFNLCNIIITVVYARGG